MLKNLSGAATAVATAAILWPPTPPGPGTAPVALPVAVPQIGVVDYGRCVASTTLGKGASQQLEVAQAAWDKTLQALRQKMISAEAALAAAEQRGADATELEALNCQMVAAYQSHEAKAPEREGELSALNRELQQRVVGAVQDALRSLESEEGGLEVALWRRDDAVVWVGPGADVTDDVIRLANERHK